MQKKEQKTQQLSEEKIFNSPPPLIPDQGLHVIHAFYKVDAIRISSLSPQQKKDTTNLFES
ncbi:MAG: hypothetical protein NZL93_06930, partial [Chthoniobacterales bacterium]|nr:hypothetical protein [Chthoniobacterales bacterium]